MSAWDDYRREERKPENKVTGKLRCVIVDVEEGVSKAGNPMITISVRPSGCNFKVRNWLVKNDNFNSNAAKFFDAFPEIQDGNFNFVEWIGAEGAANFVEDENGYLKIKDWVFPRQAEFLPPFEGDKPAKVQVTKLDDPEESEEELPWV